MKWYVLNRLGGVPADQVVNRGPKPSGILDSRDNEAAVNEKISSFVKLGRRWRLEMAHRRKGPDKRAGAPRDPGCIIAGDAARAETLSRGAAARRVAIRRHGLRQARFLR
jgi:hypothetical protein